MVAGEIEMAGVVVPVATPIGAVPVTEVTVPFPVPAPMVDLTVAASGSCRMSKAKSEITLAVMFPALLLEGKVLAGIERSVGADADPVLFTLMVLAAMFAILGLVTELAEMVAGKLPVPVATTSPVRVMVWSPEFVPVIASNLVLSVALILPATLAVAAEIEITGAAPPVEAIGAVPVTPVTVPVPAPMVALTMAASASFSMSKAKSVIG